MSSRSKKHAAKTASTNVVVVEASTPVSSQTESPGSKDMRPASPTLQARLQEKNELASLNNRLATYIEIVRNLETENSRLSQIVQTQEETVTGEVTKIKGLYEDELASARRLLDELAKEKARLQVDAGRLNSENNDLKSKLNGRENELADLSKRLIASEILANELQAKFNDSVNERNRWEDEYKKLKKEFDALTKSLSLAKKQLEEETLKRVDLENRVQSLKEELAFNNQVHEQVMNESISRSRMVQIEQSVDGSLQESVMAEALQEMREENDEQLRLSRIEMEAYFEKKLAQLQSQASGSGSESLHVELRSSQKKVEELTNELTRLRAQNASYEIRIGHLERQLKQDQEENEAIVAALNLEINKLKGDLDAQLHEYGDLMDIKIQLDREISAYRKLLESEEDRLNMSESATPASSRKRKRDEVDLSFPSKQSTHRETIADLATSSSANDVIEITETCPDGKFIKLFNTSPDKEMSLAGWQLKHNVGKDETVYKFTRTVHLKPQQTVTIWSLDSGKTHSPPGDLVMKNLKWFPGNISKTVLIDQTGEEKAVRETKKTISTTTTTGHRHLESSVDPEVPKQASKSKWSGWSLFGFTK